MLPYDFSRNYVYMNKSVNTTVSDFLDNLTHKCVCVCVFESKYVCVCICMGEGEEERMMMRRVLK